MKIPENVVLSSFAQYPGANSTQPLGHHCLRDCDLCDKSLDHVVLYEVQAKKDSYENDTDMIIGTAALIQWVSPETYKSYVVTSLVAVTLAQTYLASRWSDCSSETTFMCFWHFKQQGDESDNLLDKGTKDR